VLDAFLAAQVARSADDAAEVEIGSFSTSGIPMPGPGAGCSEAPSSGGVEA